jgi:hypothetical protein
MQLTFTAWGQSLNTLKHGQGKIYRSCHKHDSVSLRYILPTGGHLLDVSFITSLKSNLCTALTTRNSTGNNCVTWHAQNTTAFQPNVFVTVIYQLLFASNGYMDFPSLDYSQGQLQTPQLLCVVHF